MTARMLAAIVCGLIFGAGLLISDMINPGRVLAFLDVAGSWDPSLAFVMGGALIASAVAHIIRGRRPAPLLDSRFYVPANGSIDWRLVTGAALSALAGDWWGSVPAPPSLHYRPGAGRPFCSFRPCWSASRYIACHAGSASRTTRQIEVRRLRPWMKRFRDTWGMGKAGLGCIPGVAAGAESRSADNAAIAVTLRRHAQQCPVNRHAHLTPAAG